MDYQIRMVYEQADVAALVRTLEFRQHPEKGLRMARKLGYPFFGILIIMAGVGVLAGGLIDLSGILIFLASLLVGVLLIRRASSRGMERRSWKKYPNKGLVMTYSFYHDHFEEEDEVSGKNQFQYHSLASGNLDAGHYFLFTQNGNAHMLKRDSFVCGDPERFPEFLRIRAAIKLDPIDA